MLEHYLTRGKEQDIGKQQAVAHCHIERTCQVDCRYVVVLLGNILIWVSVYVLISER
jgi:hypothetical protein